MFSERIKALTEPGMVKVYCLAALNWFYTWITKLLSVDWSAALQFASLVVQFLIGLVTLLLMLKKLRQESRPRPSVPGVRRKGRLHFLTRAVDSLRRRHD